MQAAIGGIVLDNARALKDVSDEVRAEYIKYGNVTLTMAVISIIMTAPPGAILINTLGMKWLSDDSEETKAADNELNGSKKTLSYSLYYNKDG